MNNLNSLGKSNLVYNFITATATTNLTVQNGFGLVVSSITSTVNLPAASGLPTGWSVKVKNIGTSTITTVASSDSIDGNASIDLNPGDEAEFVMTGSTFTANSFNQFYEIGTHTSNWSGAWSPAQSASFNWIRIGKNVSLSFAQTFKTASAAAILTMDTALPTSLRPANFQTIAPVVNDTTSTVGGATLSNSDFKIRIYATTSFGAFTTGASRGWNGFCWPYSLN